MSGTVMILIFLAMGATLAILLAGIVTMARGGAFNRKYGNRLMRLRVIFQGVAILLFAALIFLMKGD